MERYIASSNRCFMGQEAIAKIRNMGGHPTRVVLARSAEEEVPAGESVYAGDKDVGLVMSSAGRTVIVRVTWSAHDADLHTEDRIDLHRPD
jgi:folate-binding Fe-S cluster repair protein YgfZ